MPHAVSGCRASSTGGFNTAVYRKLTDSDSHIRNSSNHVTTIEVRAMRNLIWRAGKIASTKDEERGEKILLKTISSQYGYPNHVVKKCLARKISD